MAKCSIITTLVFSALLLFLQNVHCRVIGGPQDEEIPFPIERRSTTQSRIEDEEYLRLDDSEGQSQTKKDTNEQHEIKQQDHSFRNEKPPDASLQKEEDPSVRTRREESADEHSQIAEDADVETVSSVHGKESHGKKFSNIEFNFNLKDFIPSSVPLDFAFGAKAEATQAPFQQWGSYVPQYGPQNWTNYQSWMPGYQGGQIQGTREVE